MIACGWCGKGTVNPDRCTSCGHSDPALPWEQRGQAVPTIHPHAEALAKAERDIRDSGRTPTIDRLAEALDVSTTTVKRWRSEMVP